MSAMVQKAVPLYLSFAPQGSTQLRAVILFADESRSASLKDAQNRGYFRSGMHFDYSLSIRTLNDRSLHISSAFRSGVCRILRRVGEEGDCSWLALSAT